MPILYFRHLWKLKIIKPILKKNGLDINWIELERVVSQQIIKHIERHSLLHPNQIVYIPHKNTETALNNINNDILANNLGTIIIFLDMSAAFDTLNHRTLINRLVIIGFRDDALNWLKSYITARSWYVSIGKMKSKNVHLDYVVPQGSVLGPILFNIYSPSFWKHDSFLQISFHSYADDMQIYIPASNPNYLYSCSRLRECLGKISKWCEYNSLKLNHDKTNAMLIDYRKKSTTAQFTFNFDHLQIQYVNQFTNVGVIFDSSYTRNYSLIVKFV